MKLREDKRLMPLKYTAVDFPVTPVNDLTMTLMAMLLFLVIKRGLFLPHEIVKRRLPWLF